VEILVGLKLREAWKLSHIPYVEVAFRSVQASRGSSQGLSTQSMNLNRLFKIIMRSAKISKGAFAVFGTIGAAIPFLDFYVTPGPESLVSAISLSLAISLAYVVFYSLQILPSFSNAEPFTLLSTMPIGERDFSLIALFSFLRTFDYLAIGSIMMQVGAVWILTQSVIATALMVVGALLNLVFAAAASLWLSGIFYRNVSRGGRSRKASLGRLLFLITWGFGALSIGFLFDFISYILPVLNGIIGSSSLGLGMIILVIHPFPISIAISNIVYPSLLSLSASSSVSSGSFLISIIAFASSFAYIPISILVGLRTFHSVSNISRGKDVRVARQSAKDLVLSVRKSLKAYIMKDVRLASKNPSVALLYALPFFVVVVLALVTSQFEIMHAISMIVSVVVGCSFSVMICSTLLSTEDAGLEYTMSLPVKISQLVNAKAIIAVLSFSPVPLALLAIGLSRPISSDYLLLIPFIELVAMYAACLAEVSFYMGNLASPGAALGQSKGFSPMAGADLRKLVKSLALAFAMLMLPIAGYSLGFIETSNHLVAIMLMLFVSIFELVMVLRASGQIKSQSLEEMLKLDRSN
jgi:hypothetical protein